ncbi:hypothetical protein Mkiyose1088_40410 [Mycobacterium kiyosense]|nr:hypothetical protein Mkiyose1088_40410 [Mycobacterium kiyosense]
MLIPVAILETPAHPPRLASPSVRFFLGYRAIAVIEAGDLGTQLVSASTPIAHQTH